MRQRPARGQATSTAQALTGAPAAGAGVGAATYSGNPLGLSSFDAAVLAIVGIVIFDAANKRGPWAKQR